MDLVPNLLEGTSKIVKIHEFSLIYTVFEVAFSKFGSKWIWFQIYWKALQK